MLRVIMLRVVAATLLLGGIVRIVATQALFDTFGIGELWMQTPYSAYIYRVLGGFVLLSGILLMAVSGAPEKYSRLLKAYALGFAVIGVVMLVAGLGSGLPSRHFLPDPVYCFLISALLWRSSRPPA
jgi:hypothetical protein